MHPHQQLQLHTPTSTIRSGSCAPDRWHSNPGQGLQALAPMQIQLRGRQATATPAGRLWDTSDHGSPVRWRPTHASRRRPKQ